MIKLLSQFGISIEYRVINPSRNPALIVKGKVLRNILKLFLKPILKEFTLEKVLGNNIEAPKINPAAVSITIAKISIDP
jgi:hypothetical protein